jgi:hypothetical protein
MAKTTTAGRLTKSDLSTPLGLMEEFDAQIRSLASAKRWCSSWRLYVYDNEAGFDTAGLTDPNGSGKPAILGIADEHLSESGRALKANAYGSTDEIKDKIRKLAVRRWQEAGGLATVNGILRALGIDPLTETQSYGNHASSYLTFSTPERLSREQVEGVRAAMNAAATDALATLGVTEPTIRGEVSRDWDSHSTVS